MIKLKENQKFIALSIAFVLLFVGVFASLAMDIAQSREIKNMKMDEITSTLNPTATALRAEDFVSETQASAMVRLSATPMTLMSNVENGCCLLQFHFGSFLFPTL